MAAHFAPLVGRELPKADLAVLLECLALDAGIEPGKNEIQVIFVYDAEHSRMNFCLPSDLEKEIHGMAFQSRLGEFALYRVVWVSLRFMLSSRRIWLAGRIYLRNHCNC